MFSHCENKVLLTLNLTSFHEVIFLKFWYHDLANHANFCMPNTKVINSLFDFRMIVLLIF